jgi:hypothetical protein
MRVGIISVFVDYQRRGAHKRGVLQPQVAPLIAALLPPDVEVEIVNDSWNDPDYSRDYDLLFLSALHPDFDRARQLSHYWRRRGAKTVFGGTMASSYPQLCRPYFDAVVVGDAEGSVPQIYQDFCANTLKPVYVSPAYDAARLPVPRFELMAQAQMFPVSLEASRGCPFACNFCILTGLGTRYHSRPIADVVRDIRAGFERTRRHTRWWEWHKRRTVVFYDNNLGGDLAWLGQLSDALAPLGIFWGGPITFNALQDGDLVERMGAAGCIGLYTGLETFNAESLASMNKHHNVLDDTRRVVNQCLRSGIMVDTGILLNPSVDTVDYVHSIPQSLAACGIHVPTFVAFECPIPGTPHFRRVATGDQPAFLPNALLRDFTGYTLVTRPQRASIEDFVESYRWLCAAVGSRRARLNKLASDIPRLLRRGHWPTVAADIVDHWLDVPEFIPDAGRSLIAGTDTPPPEADQVPFSSDDFVSEAERAEICGPWQVTDESGHVLPQWLEGQQVYRSRGKVRLSPMNVPDARLAPAVTASGYGGL